MHDLGVVLLAAAVILMVYYAIARLLPDLEVPPPDTSPYEYLRARHRMDQKRQAEVFPWLAVGLAVVGAALILLG